MSGVHILRYYRDKLEGNLRETIIIHNCYREWEIVLSERERLWLNV